MSSGVRGAGRASLLGAVSALVLSAGPALAQAAPRAMEGWTFTLSPYVWFAGLDGDISNRAGTTSFSADFGDIFDTLKFSAMGLFEARRGRFSLVMDTLYLNLQQGIPVPGHGAVSGGSARTQSAELSAIGLYTVVEQPGGRFEIGGGLRGWWFDTELRFEPGLLPGRTASGSTSWVDPVLALRGVLRLSDRLSFTGYGDFGGFGVGSEFTWQAMATLDWRIADNISASLGYRWIHIDYDNGRSNIDLNMSGPIVGASFRF